MSSTKLWKTDELTCKPLDTYNEILNFLENPPPWRSLCKELMPHSKSKIRNIEINHHSDKSLAVPETFCHFDPDVEDVERHEEKLPKTLVCHDMANGYHDDSYVDGTGHHDAYTFYNWAGIDIFCYFSHHLITIPPLSWINVGHDHGVKVIGTVITEWSEGALFWNEILSSEAEYQNFANALVTIAKTLKFDGWLLNIENKITKPDVLVDFVRHLNQILHQEIPHAILIWYDSVTVEGHLTWQNGLTDKNKVFFDICDGLFTNYSWTQSDVTSSVTAAGDRVTDLYIGIDVWGRNFYGGGQFNTREAVKLAHGCGCSLAIFAPAWSHEALSTDEGDVNVVAMAAGLDAYQQFLLRDRALWGSLWPFLNTTLPSRLPFKTSFCRGQGKKRRLNGEVLCPVPWYNLRHQQYQPNSAHGPHRYLLSTIEDILHESRHGAFKDHKGIIRHLDPFPKSRSDLHSTKAKEDSTVTLAKDPLQVIVENDDNVDADDVEPTVEEKTTNADNNVDAADVKPRVKEKMTNALKQLFKIKTVTIKQENTIQEDAEPGPSESDTREVELDQSMVQFAPSVKLNLGKKSRGPRQRFGLACVPDERECLELFQEDSFNGGACLMVHPSDSMCSEHRLTRLFHCDFQCEDTLIICVVTKNIPGVAEQYLNIKLFMKNCLGQDLKVVLVGRRIHQLHQVEKNQSGVLNMCPLDYSGAEFKDVQRYLLLHEGGFYVPVENSYGWVVRYYQIQLPGSRVTSINCRTGLEQGPILLGHFGICHRFQKMGVSPVLSSEQTTGPAPSTATEPKQPVARHRFRCLYNQM